MTDLITRKKCTGCEACVNACPMNCIEMKDLKHGFSYPVIDTDKCIHCNKCKKICPLNNEIIKSDYEKKVKLAYDKNLEKRMAAASGGIFGLLAEYFLSKGGVVFGAIYNENLSVSISYVESVSELIKLKGSKYVQSSVNSSFKTVKDFLDSGRYVLYSGTPCQVAGLRSYLGDTKYDRLLLVDLICHGVPSPGIYKKWLALQEEKYGDTLEGLNFRFKFEDGTTGTRLIFKSSDSLVDRDRMYMNLFLRDLILRESCYSCSFKGNDHQSDITLGDFWGYANYFSGIDSFGVSAVILNSPKGESIFNNLKDTAEILDASMKQMLSDNPSYISSGKGRLFRNLYLSRAFKAKKWSDYTNRFLSFFNLYLKIKYKINSL